jgi:hypothetical protein
MHVRSRRAIVENRPGNVQFALVSGPPDEGRAVLLLHLMQALRYRGENTQLHQVTNGDKAVLLKCLTGRRKRGADQGACRLHDHSSVVPFQVAARNFLACALLLYQ